jgi:hypothetical protein
MPELRLQNGKYICIIHPSDILLTYDLGTSRGYFRIVKDATNPNDELVVDRLPTALSVRTKKYELILENEDLDPQNDGIITLFSRSVTADGEIHQEPLAFTGEFPRTVIEKFMNFIENPHEIGEPSENVEVYVNANASNNPAGGPNARRRRNRKTRKQYRRG